jgi:type II restriction enzyme
VVFVKTIDKGKYEELIKKILEIRSWENNKIEQKFREDEHAYVNSAYEWDYYVSTFFESAGILKKTSGEVICTLIHGKSTKRKLTKNVVQLSDNLLEYCNKLQDKYPYYEKPLLLNDPERLKIDVIKEIYSFYPQTLLEEIGETKDELKLGLLNLAKLIEQYANNNEGAEAYLFEDILVDGFNMFINVEAKKIGGAGNTDIECLYITKKKKFAVDAKSTKNKLSGLNSGRLAEHRSKIGGEYTIVVTPRYVPAVLHDIKSSPIVIVRASTFSEYLYNHIDNEIRKIDYADFDKIILNNLGKDISQYISTLTIEKFSVKN